MPPFDYSSNFGCIFCDKMRNLSPPFAIRAHPIVSQSTFPGSVATDTPTQHTDHMTAAMSKQPAVKKAVIPNIISCLSINFPPCSLDKSQNTPNLGGVQSPCNMVPFARLTRSIRIPSDPDLLPSISLVDLTCLHLCCSPL